MKAKTITLITILLINITLISASPFFQPSPPSTFEGTVSYNQQSQLLNGLDISAEINGFPLGILGTIENGLYSIAIDDTQGRTGTISFYINTIKASQTAQYKIGEMTTLDLTINQLPPSIAYCGNSKIELGEQCDKTDLAGRTCGTEWTGIVTCKPNCKIDYSDCELAQPTTPQTNNNNNNDDRRSSGGGSSRSSSSNQDYTLTTEDNNTEPFPENNQEISLNQNSLITGAVTGAITTQTIAIASTFIIIMFLILFFVWVNKK